MYTYLCFVLFLVMCAIFGYKPAHTMACTSSSLSESKMWKLRLKANTLKTQFQTPTHKSTAMLGSTLTT